MKEALKQWYGTRADKELGHLQLGLSDEVFERVAASVEPFITDESAIEEFVKRESTLNLLKSYQSVADKARAEAKAKNDPSKDDPDKGKQPDSKTDPDTKKDEAIPAWAQQLIDSNKSLSEKLAGFEAKQTKEAAVAALDKFVNEWDYAKGFPAESELAKRIALKVYAAGGETMTGEQLIAAYREEFDPAVKDKGVTDFSKPFKGEDGGTKTVPDFSADVELLKAEGVEFAD